MCCKPCVIGGHHSIFSRRLAWLERPILGGYVRLHANHAEKLSLGWHPLLQDLSPPN